MGISYQIDPTQDVIVETWTGTITAGMLRDFWISLLADPAAMNLRTTLVDLREADIKFTGSELDGMVRHILLPRLGDRKWKTAILAASPIQFGTSRQYHFFAAYFSEDRIFDDRNAALQWLRKGDVPAAAGGR